MPTPVTDLPSDHAGAGDRAQHHDHAHGSPPRPHSRRNDGQCGGRVKTAVLVATRGPRRSWKRQVDRREARTGEQKAVPDLAGPKGIQEGLSQPRAVFSNDPCAILAKAEAVSSVRDSPLARFDIRLSPTRRRCCHVRTIPSLHGRKGSDRQSSSRWARLPGDCASVGTLCFDRERVNRGIATECDACSGRSRFMKDLAMSTARG